MDWLLRRLADRLGVEPPGTGEAIVPRIRAEQPLSQGVTILTVAACAALIIWLYRREGSASMPYKMTLAGLRIALVLLSLFMLSEAVLSVDRTGLPYFVIMVDDSASQQVNDQYADAKLKTLADSLARGGKSEVNRLEIGRSLITKDDGKLLTELQKQHRLRLYLVSDTTRPLASIDKPEDIKPAIEKLKAVEASREQTRLGAGVRRVLTELRGVAPTAILMFSDGQTTDGEPLVKAAEFSARKGVPIYTVGLGDAEPGCDIELAEVQVDDVVFVDDVVRFQSKINSKGYAGENLTVRLRERVSNSADPGSLVDLEKVVVKAPPDGQPLKVEIPHRPKKTGQITFVVEVDPMPRELQPDNNRIERVVTVREEKLRVLFVESEPRYEFRYLKNFLEREEKSVDVSVVLLSSDPEYSSQDKKALPTFPASKEDLFVYDVVIMGDADPSFLSSGQLANLSEFVTEKGGGVIFVAGENFNPLSYKGTPLEVLLPIELSDARNPTAVVNTVTAFRPELTLDGRSNPIFRFGEDDASSAIIWERLPESYWFFEAPRKKPAAIVLAEHPTQAAAQGKLALILYQFVGAGKVMFSAVDDTWRWRMRTGDKYFGRYWLQTIRFLARSKLLGQKQAEILTNRRRYQRNQPVEFRVRFINPGRTPQNGEVNISIERKGQGARKLALKSTPNSKNLFEGVLAQAAEGEYEVRLLPPPVLEGGIPTTTFRVDPPAGELEATQMNQPELRQASSLSGGKFFTPADFDGIYEALPKPQKVPLDTDPPIPLWNTWPVLALFLTIIVLEWVLRKRKQMV